MLSEKSVVIWDWNGTLVDDGFLFVKIMNFFLLEKKLQPISVDDYRKFFEFPLENYYLTLGFDFKDEPFESAGLDFIKIYDDRKFEPKLFDDTMPTLNTLKNSGCTHSVLSAQNVVTLKKSVSHYQLDGMFEYISGLKDHYAIGKVDQGKNLINNLNLHSDQVAMIGDTESGATTFLMKKDMYTLQVGKLKRDFQLDIDDFGQPDWKSIDPRTYSIEPHGMIIHARPMAPIITTRGCPYSCTYCSAPITAGKRMRYRDTKNVVDEIEMLVNDFGVKEIKLKMIILR